MLPVSYQVTPFALVLKPADLFNSSSSESIKVKSIYDTAKSVFGANSVSLEVSEDSKFYRYNIFSSDYRKISLGYMIFIPAQRRLDVWVGGEAYPFIQYKGKTIAFKNYSDFLDKLGLPRLFDRFSGIL